MAFSVLLLGAGSTYAAQNPEQIYAAKDAVVSIDNIYLVNKDLDAYTPTVHITGVTEDSEAFYVTYDLSTIALDDAVWRDVIETRSLKVHKDSLLDQRDLGAFVTVQLSQIIDRELVQLQKTQVFEKKQVSQKQVVTTHTGLVGMFMDEKTETLPAYTPIETPLPKPKPQQPKPKTPPEDSIVEDDDPEDVDEDTSDSSPKINLLGSKTVQVSLGEAYSDLGVHVTDREDGSLSATVAVDGVVVNKVTLDTSATTTYTITYTAVDSSGNTASADRKVVVGDVIDTTPSGGGGGGSSAPTTPASSSATSTQSGSGGGGSGSGSASSTPKDTSTTTSPQNPPATPPATTTPATDPPPPATTPAPDTSTPEDGDDEEASEPAADEPEADTEDGTEEPETAPDPEPEPETESAPEPELAPAGE